LFALFNRRQPLSWMFMLAIVLSALLFGFGHLPYAFAIGVSHTPMLISEIVFLNALVGLVTGTLFWKYGLEHAMLAHFGADLVLHVAAPLMGY
jgi:membrane protease YdiL (CAAX protease family)